MTNPRLIAHTLAKIVTRVNSAQLRLDAATDNIQRNTADGYTTNYRLDGDTSSRSDITDSTAHAADQRLGDLWHYPCSGTTPCNEPTHLDDKGRHVHRYTPGPITQLNDVHDYAHAALTALDMLHRALTDCGVPPSYTAHLMCIEYGDGRNCDQWKDPNRNDGRCVDHGRTADSNARRRRRHDDRTDIPA